MHVTHVSQAGDLLDVVVHVSDDDTVVGARNWLRKALGVESGVGMVMRFPPDRVVLSVPASFKTKIGSIVFTGE